MWGDEMEKMPWSQLPAAAAAEHFQVNPHTGLSSGEAARRLKEKGHNVLAEKKKTSPLVLFLMQFSDFMVLVLLGATLLSALLGEYSDAVVIIGVVLLNAVLGFIQEYKAEQSLEALRELTAPTAKTLRDGVRHEIPAEELVPGDIVLIEAGDRIPADIRLCEVRQLLVNEASLTGESEPAAKIAETLPEEKTVLGERVNMVFMGTMAVGGYASGVVVATGMATEMGRVAHLIQDAENEDTPLQKRLEQLGRYLVIGCLLICALVVMMGVAQGLPAYNMFMAGISLAVAAIPEGLPAVVTIALAIGVQRMVRKNAIVRRLPAVETLGCATIICSDKTGTLTQNKMNVQEIWTGGQHYYIEGTGYSPQGKFIRGKRQINPGQDTALMLTLTAAVLCNNAQLLRGKMEIQPLWRGRAAEWEIQGDPTEGALLVAGARAGLWREDLERNRQRLGEVAFDGTRKRMSVLYSGAEGEILYIKGAPEVIVEKCSHMFYQGRVVELTGSLHQEILQQNERMAALALRNLAVAYRPLGKTTEITADLEKELIFLGLLGMIDPPRPEAHSAIQKCSAAGIKTIMITGDHKTTAVAIARKLNMLPPRGQVLTGRELDELSDKELEKAAANTYVYARVAPEHKLRIVRALKRRGHIVAMTGDGVNDAPAVKEADIGIAMGSSGTDVTKEAAALVLTDDNFTTIVNAIEEGRGIYDNIRKFIRFLLACNTGEILTMLVAMLLGLPVPLRAIQILWINLVTDGLPAMALGVDPADPGIMNRPPRSPQESIFARGLWQKIVGRGVVIGLTTLIIFSWALQQGCEVAEARTMAFVTLIITQMVYVFDCRSEERSLLQIPLYSNPWLVVAVLSSIGLLLAVLYHPVLMTIFATCPLQKEQWLVVLGACFLPVLINGLYAVLKGSLTPRMVIMKK